MATGITQSA